MDDLKPPSKDTLLTFPCDFTIKIFGKATDEFEAAVLMIVHKHIASFSDREIKSRASESGKYRALSITIHVESKEQLDAIYQELSSSPHVIMSL